MNLCRNNNQMVSPPVDASNCTVPPVQIVVVVRFVKL